MSRATVRVDGRVTGAIGCGYVLLVGLAKGDTGAELEWMARKIVSLRLFPDRDGKMNLALDEVGGAILAISQFTLLGEARRGRRPSFDHALEPQSAALLFDGFVTLLGELLPRVETGVFGARMEVELVNDGPVTLVLERQSGEG